LVISHEERRVVEWIDPGDLLFGLAENPNGALAFVFGTYGIFVLGWLIKDAETKAPLYSYILP
jgi:hypothetical protein